MTATNPVPWINPLNSSMFGNYQAGSDAMLPAAQPFNPTTQNANSLDVPNQLGMPQLGTQEIDTIGLQQRYPGLVVCDDGTMLDIDSHKVILDPNEKFKKDGYWGDPNKQSKRTGGSESCWDDNQINTFEPDPMLQNLSPEDVKYNKFIQQKSKELSSSMSDEQKELLKDIDSGKILKLTSLEEE